MIPFCCCSLFKADIAEKAKELEDMRTSRGQFANRGNTETKEAWIAKSGKELLYAHMLGQMTGKGWSTEYATNLLEKTPPLEVLKLYSTTQEQTKIDNEAQQFTNKILRTLERVAKYQSRGFMVPQEFSQSLA